MEMKMQREDILDTAETFAEFLLVNPAEVYRLVQEEKIPYFRVGSRKGIRIWRAAAVDALSDQNHK